MAPVTEIEGPVFGASVHAERILRALPQWFGIEEALVAYVEQAGVLPTFLAKQGDEVVGFLCIERHYPRAAEVHVVGVLPGAHRSGIGRALQEAAERWLRTEGVSFLQVKTLSPTSPDPNYAKTRAFYAAIGFVPLEELPTLWDAHNPCLIMIKHL